VVVVFREVGAGVEEAEDEEEEDAGVEETVSSLLKTLSTHALFTYCTKVWMCAKSRVNI
jgi:hypothetical protein